MKILNLLIFSLIIGNVFAQEVPEKKIESKVNQVTVFIDKAQITRIKTVDLSSGTSILKFVNLSPFIDAKSIQVKTNGNVTVLNVNQQQNFIEKLDKPEKIQELGKQIENLKSKLELEEAYVSIIKEELLFLNDNRVVGGKNNELSVTTLKEASEFYSTQLTKLKLQEIEKNKEIKKLKKQKKDLQNQIKTLTSKKEFPSGEVLVKVKTDLATRASFALSYLVDNAGWYPTYDIRAKSLSEPIEIVYKANVRQDSKVDWNNVNLKFSSSNPNTSGVAPVLKTYFLDYYSTPPTYNKTINTVSGKVFDNNNEPLPGATIMIPETTIGTVTNVDGSYSITIPVNAQFLSFSFIGLESKTLPINGSLLNVRLNPSNLEMQEVVVVNDDLEVALQGRVAGVSVRGRSTIKKGESESNSIPIQRRENQTSFEFNIETPYSIKSDNKSYSVDMAAFSIPATFQYYAIPKINKNAYLIANIINWEKYNLLEGEANLFFEETYVGKTILDISNASDTLRLSLGNDKNVTIKREKIKDLTTKKFIGSKKIETRTWKTTIRNNKNQAINMLVLDQVPVPKLDEIEIDIQEVSGGLTNNENGEIKWIFKLNASDTKELDLKYTVKYPKSRSLIIE